MTAAKQLGATVVRSEHPLSEYQDSSPTASA